MVKVTTEIEVFQRSFKRYAESTQNTSWTVSFEKEYKSVNGGFSIAGAIKNKFSANVAADVGKTLGQFDQNANFEKNTQAEYTEFGKDLQLFRRITTVISIDGDTLRSEVEEKIDTIPRDQLYSDEKLRNEAITYMHQHYEPNNLTDIPNKNVALFEQSSCIYGNTY